MGGANETVMDQKVATADKGSEVVGKIRFHESGGEVHFHDDENRLKVAVPAATWFAAWQRLENSGGEWSYIDAGKQTLLSVAVEIIPGKPKKKKAASVDVLLSVEKIEPSDTFSKLRKFTSA